MKYNILSYGQHTVMRQSYDLKTMAIDDSCARESPLHYIVNFLFFNNTIGWSVYVISLKQNRLLLLGIISF